MARRRQHGEPSAGLLRSSLVGWARGWAFCVLWGWNVVPVAAEDTALPDFSREILPLLSNNCFKCHGPDEAQREAGLRLDERAGAIQALDSGDAGIVPGDSAASAVYQRISSSDPDFRMPPADSGKSLTDDEIERIQSWIDGGAEWGQHWAFVPARRPTVPDPVPAWRPLNGVDLFIHERLQREGLAPEVEADRATLIRRVTLDLTGLPPTIAEIEAYLADTADGAFERVVDRLLESNRYGEHMARIWLDAARYADTHGLHLDNERSVWPYRDWVIASFNRNQPFDEFTVEQLAGDLLPEPTLEQRVATGFNRCNVTTGEGGSIDDEYYVRYAVDRVETTSTVWLGLTAGCAACHDHKFDPLTQKEFYQLFSYFFSLTEKAMDGNALLPPPAVRVPTEEQRRQKGEWQAQLTGIDREVEQMLASLEYSDDKAGETLETLATADRVWFDDALPDGAKPAGNEGGNSWKFVGRDAGAPVLSGETSSVRTAAGLSQHFFTEAKNPLVISEGDVLFAYVYLDPKNPPETVQLQFNDGSWEHRGFWGADKGHAPGRNNATNLRLGDLPETGKWVRLEVPAARVALKPGAKVHGWAFTQFGGTVHWDKAGVVTIAPLSAEKRKSLSLWEQYRALTQQSVPGEVQKVLDLALEDRNDAQWKTLTRYFLEHVHPDTKEKLAKPRQQQASVKKQLDELEKAIPSTLVMEDRKEPRQAHILERGEYTKKRDKVSSRIPEWIAPALPDAPNNRLGLAQWLVRPEHPLTARVTVNRFWQQLFGIGLVRTSEDFGVQGEHPSHPALLDWLALEFVERGWNVKDFLRMLVTSRTYRQASRVDAAKLAVDPENRLLARGARFRLDAEVIRDQALAVAGLLVGKIGGKSVRPYQPPGLWKPVGFGGSNTATFVQDKGDKLYRRSMYTFWKRTSPPPSMATFDAPDRETCQVRRPRTNTPLQALVLLNDVQYVEAARKFAERILQVGGDSMDDRLTFAFRSVLAREPGAEEMTRLLELFEECQREYRDNTEAAKQLLASGESPRDESLEVGELAAWTMVAHVLFNLSETVTRS